jgi:hypothetical protein
MSRSAGPTQFIEFRPGMRRLIEDAIESLILLLDEIDGDEGPEDDDREQDYAEAGIADRDGLQEQCWLQSSRGRVGDQGGFDQQMFEGD